ncbi:small ribosomal subunit protein mS37 [Culicoides brevitarsis]|uniref:small ribosomal subunit protein mS37 n=1 Tax=Culicoides brevitarsis TaxID=469753 RepID=UPI00307BED41
MRQTAVLFHKKALLGWQSKRARLPQNVNRVPFAEVLPLKLRDRVSGKGSRVSDVACVQEMTTMFACLKANEFNEAACTKEIDALSGCYTAFLEKKSKSKEDSRKGGIRTGKNLDPRELNRYLKKFPVETRP